MSTNRTLLPQVMKDCTEHDPYHIGSKHLTERTGSANNQEGSKQAKEARDELDALGLSLHTFPNRQMPLKRVSLGHPHVAVFLSSWE